MEGSYRLFSNSRQKNVLPVPPTQSTGQKQKSSNISPAIFACGKLPQDPSLFLSGLDRSSNQAPHNTEYKHKVCVVSKASSFTVTKSCTTAQGLSVNNALNSSQPLWAMTAVGRERVENVGFHLYCRLNLWQNGCFMAACVWNNINVGFAAVQNSL